MVAQSPQLEAILAPIRLAQERQEYAALVASNDSQQSRYGDPFDPSSSAFVAAQAGSSWNPNTGTASALTTKQEWDSVKKELGAVFNVLASMGGVATAVWWAAGNTPLVQVRLITADKDTVRLLMALATENAHGTVRRAGDRVDRSFPVYAILY